MTNGRTKIAAVAAAALLAVGMPLGAHEHEPEGEPKGVIVSGVDPDGPAAAAGLERGDLILAVDGIELESPQELVRALADAEGDEITLTVKHGDDVRDQVVTLDRVWGQPRVGLMISGGADVKLDFLKPGERRMPMGPLARVFSFRMDRDGRGEMLLDVESDEPGVVVMEVIEDSPAADAGLQPGDWLIAVADEALDGPAEQLVEIIMDHEPGDEVSVDFERDGEPMTAMVVLGEDAESGAAMLGIRYQALPMFEEMRERLGDLRIERRRWHGGREDRDWGKDKDQYPDMDKGGDMDAGSAL